MPNIIISVNMNLPIPVTGVDPGPDWANNVNACLGRIDGHDHTPGNGVQITPTGLNINSDLTFNANNAVALRALRLTSYASFGAFGVIASDLNEFCCIGADVYWIDGNGNQVRITQSGGVAGSPGSISNLTSPASASYVALSSTFVWQSAANMPANLDAASIILRNLTANSKGLTLSPPNSMAADYTLTLPPLPTGTNFVTLNPSGGFGAFVGTDNTTIQISGNNFSVTPGGITGTQIATNVNMNGNAVQENGKNVIVSNENATVSLSVVRGSVRFDGVIISGEGFTVNPLGGGGYTLTYSHAFSDTPTIVASPLVNAGSPPIVFASSNGSIGTVTITNANTGSGLPNSFGFIVIGQRS